MTKHADILAIERDNDLWTNGPHPILFPAELDDQFDAMRDAGIGLLNLVHMDGGYHQARRAIGADWFSPRMIRTLKGRVDELATRYVNYMAEMGPECEFVNDIALAYLATSYWPCLACRRATFPCCCPGRRSFSDTMMTNAGVAKIPPA